MTLENRLEDFAIAVGQDIKALNEKVKTFVYNQSIPSATWIITHNLDKYPSIEVVDSAGSLVEGEVTYNNNNQVTVSFIGAFSGVAYLN